MGNKKKKSTQDIPEIIRKPETESMGCAVKSGYNRKEYHPTSETQYTAEERSNPFGLKKKKSKK